MLLDQKAVGFSRVLLCISEEELIPLSAVYSRVRDAVDFRKG